MINKWLFLFQELYFKFGYLITLRKNVSLLIFSLREERTDDRVMALDQKPRDLSSQNGESKGYYHHVIQKFLEPYVTNNIPYPIPGSSNGHSPVLNLSKSGINHSTSEPSEHSEDPHSPTPSVVDEEEENFDTNVSEVDEREEKEEGGLIF